MLRECIRYENLASIILQDERFFDFFNYVEMSTFDISSDAFSTFKVTYSLTTQKPGQLTGSAIGVNFS